MTFKIKWLEKVCCSLDFKEHSLHSYKRILPVHSLNAGYTVCQAADCNSSVTSFNKRQLPKSSSNKNINEINYVTKITTTKKVTITSNKIIDATENLNSA